MTSVFINVRKHLIKAHNMTCDAANVRMGKCSFATIVRMNNRIERLKIIANYNYCVRENGKIYVANTLKLSSMVAL